MRKPTQSYQQIEIDTQTIKLTDRQGRQTRQPARRGSQPDEEAIQTWQTDRQTDSKVDKAKKQTKQPPGRQGSKTVARQTGQQDR